MNRISRGSLGTVIIMAALALSVAPHLLAATTSEESLIQTLNTYLNPSQTHSQPHPLAHQWSETRTEVNARDLGQDPDVVGSLDVRYALAELAKNYPTSEKALPLIKRLLTDSNVDVRCKAARALGTMHATLAESDIKAICTLLKSEDGKVVEEGLKALRGLKAPSAVPDVLLVLKSSNSHNVRDACRTLATLAGKEVIPSIEPLLHCRNRAVRKDAEQAIATLRENS